eukprot:4690137-Pyramimonas_sp.AAC.1
MKRPEATARAEDGATPPPPAVRRCRSGGGPWRLDLARGASRRARQATLGARAPLRCWREIEGPRD